jgi:NAD(P)-dependent dehydrogenase (short-subunit alcohol dehydrogenase family)
VLLENKVVVIQGVGPGLGQQLALGAAREGADVVLAARTPAVVEEVAERVRALGRRALAVPTDIADRAQCDRLVARSMETFGRIDALLNSAMTHAAGEFESADLDDWRRVMEVNCFGYLNVTQAVLPNMRKQGSGAIVMVNTMSTKDPLLGTGAYATSKGALAAATRALAKELAPHGIRVNQVYIGWMWGPPVQGMLTLAAKAQGTTVEALKADVEKQIPLGRMPEDHECANTVLFLASDLASVVVGASIDVNGGQLLGS